MLACAVGMSATAGWFWTTTADQPRDRATDDRDAPATTVETRGETRADGTDLGERPATLAGTVVTAPDGSFAITLPPGWLAGFIGPGLPPVGEQMFPGAPAGSAEITPVLAFATWETRMLATVPLPAAGGPIIPVAVLQIDSRASVGADDLPARGAHFIEYWTIDGTTTHITDEGMFDSANGPVGWVAFQTPGNAFGGVRYMVAGDDMVWYVTYWQRSTAEGHGIGDQMVASLTPVPAGT